MFAGPVTDAAATPNAFSGEAVDVKEEADPPGCLPADHRGLVVAVRLGEQQAGDGPGRPDDDPSLGPPVIGQGRGVLGQLEAQDVGEEPDGRVVFADHDGDETEMHGA